MMTKHRGYSAQPKSVPDDGGVEASSAIGARDETHDLRYRLVSIDPVRAPADCAGSDWHIYRIAQGENAITGYRRGDVASIKVDVETIVAALNQRRQATKGKEPSKSHGRAAPAAPANAAK